MAPGWQAGGYGKVRSRMPARVPLHSVKYAVLDHDVEVLVRRF